MLLLDFFKDHIRYNRTVDKDAEELWDLMICGHAVKETHETFKTKIFNWFLNILGIFASLLGQGIIIDLFYRSIPSDKTIEMLICLFVLPVIVNTTLRFCIKRPWLRILLSFVIPLVTGLVIGLIFSVPQS